MAIIIPEFKDYTYIVSYKLTPSSDEVILVGASRIIPATAAVISGGSVVDVPNPNYNFAMVTVESHVPPTNEAILIIKRNKVESVDDVTHDKTELAPITEIYSGSFDFLNYDRRVGFIIQDTKVGESEPHTILVQVLNLNTTEKIQSKYAIYGFNFAGNFSAIQHVDLAYKGVDDDEWVNIANNIEVATDGSIDPIYLTSLVEDHAYLLKVYHHELDETKEFNFHSNLVPAMGENPIIGKIEWNGRTVTFAAPGVKSRMYPNAAQVDWMFPMDYNTKSFTGIVSSLWAFNEDYNFKMVVSDNNPEEVYIGCGITNGRYLSLPFDHPIAVNNINYNTFFGTAANPNERRTIFVKFYINTNHQGPVKLIRFNDGTEQFIGFNVDVNGIITFVAFSGTYTLPIGQTIELNKWYTLALIVKDNTILFASITNSTNYSLASMPIGVGATIGNVDSRNVMFDGARADVEVVITYDAVTADEEHMGLVINYANYQWLDNDPGNNQIDKGSSPPQLITNGAGQTMSFTIPNPSGYGTVVGYSLKFLYGGVTSNGSVNITAITVNGVNVTANMLASVLNIDEECQDYIGGNQLAFSYLKTGDEIGLPIGGILFENIDLTEVIDTASRVYIGGGVQPLANYVVSKFGFKKVITGGVDDWANPYQYLHSDVFEMLSIGYKRMPKLRATNVSSEVNYISVFNMTEMKNATVMFYLENLPVGETVIDVMSDTDVLSSITRNIKPIKTPTGEAAYDIDFTQDFGAAIVEFKRRYYAKQKRWGGNMGGGTHGALIYYNRGEKCLILEQHGDLYDGAVPAVLPAGRIGYGLPTDITETVSSTPRPLEQRTTRVGGLIQSVDYHGYGMFDCWFSVPKGMAGLAICLWYFHYQEIYSYDGAFDFWVNTGWAGTKYDEAVQSSGGSTWVTINNEIDMELGSENTPYRTEGNPNLDTSITWYVNGLSEGQCVACEIEGPDYGTWMIDWVASQPAIQAVVVTDPRNVNAYLKTNQLVWKKINNKVDAVNYGANNRSCRFNNWLGEVWNDGTGFYGNAADSPLGRHELTVNNRTPLGKINIAALEQNLRYIEKYYDDGQYHKWSIDWTKDYTRLLIDDEEIALLKAFVPFNVMTMLVGCWFPSGNVYDKNVILGEYGTWGGVHANWGTALMRVNRIKFTPYTEEEVPTNQLRYDCETYGEDGLREIL